MENVLEEEKIEGIRKCFDLWISIVVSRYLVM